MIETAQPDGWAVLFWRLSKVGWRGQKVWWVGKELVRGLCRARLRASVVSLGPCRGGRAPRADLNDRCEGVRRAAGIIGANESLGSEIPRLSDKATGRVRLLDTRAAREVVGEADLEQNGSQAVG
jgi:hypothetical protein